MKSLKPQFQEQEGPLFSQSGRVEDRRHAGEEDPLTPLGFIRLCPLSSINPFGLRVLEQVRTAHKKTPKRIAPNGGYGKAGIVSPLHKL